MSDSLDTLDDCQLIARYCAGDKKAGDILGGRHRHKLIAFIEHGLRRFRLDVRSADDIFQQLWLTLLERDYHGLKRYNPDRGCRFLNYLKKIASRFVDKCYRRQARTRNREVPLAEREPIDPGADEALLLGNTKGTRTFSQPDVMPKLGLMAGAPLLRPAFLYEQ